VHLDPWHKGGRPPNQEFVTVEQAADLSIFLCSKSGSSMNGTAVSMDGGWTASDLGCVKTFTTFPV
jgi:hypothetical protein